MRIAVIFLEAERTDLNEQKKRQNIVYMSKQNMDNAMSFTFNTVTYSNNSPNNVIIR